MIGEQADWSAKGSQFDMSSTNGEPRRCSKIDDRAHLGISPSDGDRLCFPVQLGAIQLAIQSNIVEVTSLVVAWRATAGLVPDFYTKPM